jgi:putative heme-binding domain-containing protein
MRKRYWVPAVLLAVGLATACRVVQQESRPVKVNIPEPPYGIASRSAWTAGRVSGSPEAPPPFQTERVFPNITFRSPLEMTVAPSLGRVLVLEQKGKIFSFAERNDVEKADLLLDLSQVHGLDQVPDCKGTGDAYGIALHPEFEKNHYCYICYTLDYFTRSRNHENGSRVSRFTVSNTGPFDKAGPPTIDPASEVVVLQWLSGGHNGGCLKFGRDGYLYISTGDGGDPNPPDPFNTGQDVSDLLCSILRIDVNHAADGKNYSIPPDNPFVSLAGARPEVWAYGLRNPWRMNFDRQTGNLWVGDVGWELWESIVCATPGGNYGWSIMEGPNPVHPQGKRGPTPLIGPSAALPHTEAASITGGVVYRGQELPELAGQYLFGDWQTQGLWAAKCIGDKQDHLEPYRLIAQTDEKIVAFGERSDGEPIILDHGGGGLWKIVRNPDVDKPRQFPHKLSETGLFASTKDQTPAPGVIPFNINAAQWVDGANSQRWIAVPGTEKVKWGKGVWGDDKPAWPKDSVLVRTLSMPVTQMGPSTEPTTRLASSPGLTKVGTGSITLIPGHRRVETQLLHFDGRQWHGYSYAWKDDLTDADLVDAGGDTKSVNIPDGLMLDGTRKQRWQFASRAQCMTCHNVWCDYTLAFDLRQLDQRRRFDSGVEDNQIRTFRHIGLLTEPLPAKQPGPGAASGPHEPDDKATLVDPHDTSADLYERARSYLHVNCSHCHRFGAGGSALFDVRKEVPLDKTHTINVRPNLGDFGITDGKIICAGDAARSVMLYRMAKLGRERMPHIGSEVVDDKGVELISQWAASLPGSEAQPTPEAASARVDQDAALQKLESPGTAAPDLAVAVDKLLSSPGGALALICELEAGRVIDPARQAVISAGIASHQDLVHDLFRRFDPNDSAGDRLGPNINPAKVLALTGDAQRGRKLFHETAGGLCAKCHRTSEGGTDFGPDLSHIAAKYNRADLLDNILNPSKTIAQGFTTYVVKTASGDVFTGLLVKQTDQEVVLKDATLKETHVPAADVEKITPQTVSAMPEGLLNDLTTQQAADLMTFLMTQK